MHWFSLFSGKPAVISVHLSRTQSLSALPPTLAYLYSNEQLVLALLSLKSSRLLDRCWYIDGTGGLVS